MKANLALMFVIILAGHHLVAQEASPIPTPTEAVPQNIAPAESDAAESEELITSTEVLESIQQEGLPEFIPSVIDASAMQLTPSSTNTSAAAPTNNLTTVELKKVQISGTTTPVVQKRTFGSFLQLFNPFAPSEYGGTTPVEGKTASRAFLDPIETQPGTVLISVGNKPSKPD